MSDKQIEQQDIKGRDKYILALEELVENLEVQIKKLRRVKNERF